MNTSDTLQPLWSRHGQLREQLHTAYTADVYDSHRIDQIAEQMLQVEQALVSGRTSRRVGDRVLLPAPGTFVRWSSF